MGSDVNFTQCESWASSFVSAVKNSIWIIKSFEIDHLNLNVDDFIIVFSKSDSRSVHVRHFRCQVDGTHWTHSQSYHRLTRFVLIEKQLLLFQSRFFRFIFQPGVDLSNRGIWLKSAFRSYKSKTDFNPDWFCWRVLQVQKSAVNINRRRKVFQLYHSSHTFFNSPRASTVQQPSRFDEKRVHFEFI